MTSPVDAVAKLRQAAAAGGPSSEWTQDARAASKHILDAMKYARNSIRCLPAGTLEDYDGHHASEHD